MSEKTSIVKTASLITLITLISKAFGFLREIIIAYYFGTSNEVDMYLMAVNIPTIILGFISCVGTAYVPVYNEISVKEGKKQSLGFTTQLVIVMSLICGTVILICSFNAEFITKLAAPGFTEEMVGKTAGYLRISLWNLLVTTVMNIFICYLNCNNKFVQASGCMLFHSSVQIIFTFLAHFIGPVFLTVGYVIANVFYFAALLVVSLKNDYKFNSLYFERKYARLLVKLLIPIAVSSLVTQINGYVDKYYGSKLAEGSISALHYSDRIRTFVVLMLDTGLITMFFPMVSRLVSEGKMAEVKKALVSSARYVIVVFLPITILLIIFSESVTKLLFERGQFDTVSVSMTSTAIRMYAIGITAVALRDVFFNFYYSVKDTTFALIVSAIGILVNIGLNTFLINKMGIAGLALATSVAAIFSIPIFLLRIRKYIRVETEDGGLMKFVYKCIISNLIPLCVMLLINRILQFDIGIFIAIVEGLLFLVVYYVMLRVFKVEETSLLKDIFRRVLRKSGQSGS